jgi:hypothetical protein
VYYRPAMNMEPMSLRQLILNNPEWFSALTSALFAAITVTVITWQLIVMRWQAHNSNRHERIRNQLIRLQHEHEWIIQRNREREQLLKLARKLNLAASCVKDAPSDADSLHMEEVRDTVDELNSRLSILDVATFCGEYDDWFPALAGYVSAMLNAVIEEPNLTPGLPTRKALSDIRERCEPTKIFLDLEKAIRLEFFDFKNRWDAILSAV